MSFLSAVSACTTTESRVEYQTKAVTYIDEQTKDDPPVDGHEDVQRPVNKSAREWNEEQQREQYSQRGNDFSIDEPAELP